MKITAKIFLLILFSVSSLSASDGYNLWLGYRKITDQKLLQQYRSEISNLNKFDTSKTLKIAEEELKHGLEGLLEMNISVSKKINNGSVILAKKSIINDYLDAQIDIELGQEGFVIKACLIENKKVIIISGNSDVSILYGSFHFLRLLQQGIDLKNIDIVSVPKIKIRVLNHWDNLDRTSERGYAGFSIWDWHKLPDYIDTRYIDYARANSSIGINGTVLTNVNSNALVLTPMYLKKVKALADVFRPYGIRVYLTARFSAPIEIGGLETADPLNEKVRTWWKNKVKEIYKYIPDFGGFLVKANSEGQPGPQDYNRTQADGANLLADAVEPYKGIVMWRAFVYSNLDPTDRAKQAVNEFKPLDGKFHKNVLIQTKNGAIDFQPREPFHPLFGSMPNSQLMMEFQITQEYLGQGTSLVYLAPLYKECLDSDTYASGKGSYVSKVIDGSLNNHSLSGIAGVANIGTDRNWTGHLFGQANWYAFGRLAWDYELSSEVIAEEWIKQSISYNDKTVTSISEIMLNSREACVNYMTPLGLHHMMGWSHHYGPAPWIKDKQRKEWTSVYYHKADEKGIGFNRTITGSNAVSQYFPEVAENFGNLKLCPQKYLLWFHHVDWDFKLKSGRILWDEMAYKYQEGVDSVRAFLSTWKNLEKQIDPEKFNHVKMLLKIQIKEAIWWRDACLSYFQTFSKMELPAGVEKPAHSLEYYQSLQFPYAPGIKPKW